jgi:hypothetical protein
VAERAVNLSRSVSFINQPPLNMKQDIYTKIVLTVIAVALVFIAMRDVGVIPVARAARPETMDVNIESVSKYAFKQCKPIQVEVMADYSR